MVRGLLGDPRQAVHQRVIGQRSVLGDAFGQLHGLGESKACRHVVLRHAGGHAFGGLVDAAGEHHVQHAVGAGQLGYTHRAAAADEDAARALGQREESRVVGHAQVAGAGQFQAAAYNGAVQRGDDRHAAELDVAQDGVPGA